MNDQSKPDLDESKAPLIEHLIELRQRLLWSVAALTVAFLISMFFADEIFGILVQPLTDAFPAGEGKLIYTKLYEAFLPFLIATPVLFMAGASLAYFIVMPTAFKFFLGFEGPVGGLQQEALPAMGDYLSLVMQFILAFGVCFQLPVLLLLLNRAGIVSRQQLKGARRYMVVGAFAVAAILTPPDVVSQLMLGIPLILLYEVSLAIMWFTERKKSKEIAA